MLISPDLAKIVEDFVPMEDKILPSSLIKILLYIWFSFLFSTNIVRPSTVSLNCFIFNKDGINCNCEFFIIPLDKFSNVGFTTLVNISCTNIIKRAMRNIRFTI